MIRFLITCALLLVLYLGFYAVGQYDSILTVNVYGYTLQTSCFTFMAFASIVILGIVLVLRIVFTILSLPTWVKTKIKANRARNEIDLLMEMASYQISFHKKKVLKLAQKLSAISPEYLDFYHLIMAESEDNFDVKINHFRQLLSSKKHEFFALKRIAELYFASSLHTQALDYAIMAYNIKEDDQEILELMLHCYAKDFVWDRVQFILSKIKHPKPALARQISEYYLTAAKEILEQGDDSLAVQYLEKSLTYCQANIEVLDLYCSLQMTLGNKTDLPDILLNSFKINPSFEIAELYCKVSSEPNDEILQSLKRAASPKKYRGVFFAIEGYLEKEDYGVERAD